MASRTKSDSLVASGFKSMLVSNLIFKAGISMFAQFKISLLFICLAAHLSFYPIAKADSKTPSVSSSSIDQISCQPSLKFEDEDGVQFIPMNLELIMVSSTNDLWSVELFDISDVQNKVSLGTAQLKPSILKLPINDDILEMVSYVLDIAKTDVVRIELFELADQGDDATGASFLRVYSQFQGFEFLAGDVFQMGWGAGVCGL